MLMLKHAIPRNVRNFSAFNSPYEVDERSSMKMGKEQKEDKTREERDRMERGTDKERVGWDGKERDARSVSRYLLWM